MTDSPRYYILISDQENWDKSFEIKTWGFTERTKGSWNKSNVGELVAFYVTSPVKKIVGFGRITEKFINDDMVWPDEFMFNRSMWKYKMKFEIIFKLNDSSAGVSVPATMILNQSRKVISKDLFFDLVKKSEEQWNVKIEEAINRKITQ